MKLHPFPLAKLAVAAVLMTSAAAQAVPLLFTITGDYSASWTMDSNPKPDFIRPDGQYFTLFGVTGTFQNATGPVDLSFYSIDYDGGLEIDDVATGDALLVTMSNPQLYTGSQATPVFSVGKYTMTQYGGTTPYTLTVSAVPEPATVASMLAGLGLVGAAIRRRRAPQV